MEDSLETKVETLENDRVRVTITVPAEDVDRSIDNHRRRRYRTASRHKPSDATSNAPVDQLDRAGDF